MKQILLFIFILGFSQITSAQDQKVSNQIVGFACSISGQPSKSVSKVATYIKDKDYQAVAQLLGSANNAERFLAVIVIERLVKLNKYGLSSEQKAQIYDAYNSKASVFTCSGCTDFQKMTLAELLTKDRSMMRKYAEEAWLGFQLGLK